MPTITKSIKAGYETRIVWDIDSQNIPNNTSIVTVKVQLVSTDSLSTISETAIKYGSLTIDGETNNFTFSAVLSGNQIKTVYTKTVIIPHNEDGTKICAFSASIGIALALSGTYYGTINISGSGAFTTIPRPSSISLSASSVEMGNTLTINISRSASSLTHR
jgi:putative tail protein